VDSLWAKAPYFGFPTPTYIYIYTLLRCTRHYGGQALTRETWGALIVEMRANL